MRYMFFSLLELLILTVLGSCKDYTKPLNETTNADSIVTHPKMSVADAEKYMFTKESDYQPAMGIAIDLNGKSNKGVLFKETKNYLDQYSIEKALVCWLEKKQHTEGSTFSFNWGHTPIDTLYVDDFNIDEEGNLYCTKDVMQAIEFDYLWCSVIADVLAGEMKDQQIVMCCRKNLQKADDFLNTIRTNWKSCKKHNTIPHTPFIYVYPFCKTRIVYMEHLQRNAIYSFNGYSFCDARQQKLLYVVEEFNF